MDVRTIRAFSEELRKIATNLLAQPVSGVVNQVPQAGAQAAGSMVRKMRMPRAPTVGLPSTKV